MSYSGLCCQDLVRLCAATGNAEAWEEFVGRFHRLICGVAYRTACRWVSPTQDLVEDIVQEVYVKLCDRHCQRLTEFQPESPEAFYGYLRVVTSNLVSDYFKARGARKRGEQVTSSHSDDAEPPAPPSGLGSSAAVERQILLKEIDRWLVESGCGNEARIVFWMYYREGLTSAAIAALPQVCLSVKGVESALLRMTRQARAGLGG